MALYVSTGRTESGDDLEPLIWRFKPKENEVTDAYRVIYPMEFEEVGFVNHRTSKAFEQPLRLKTIPAQPKGAY